MLRDDDILRSCLAKPVSHGGKGHINDEANCPWCQTTKIIAFYRYHPFDRERDGNIMCFSPGSGYWHDEDGNRQYYHNSIWLYDSNQDFLQYYDVEGFIQQFDFDVLQLLELSGRAVARS